MHGSGAGWRRTRAVLPALAMLAAFSVHIHAADLNVRDDGERFIDTYRRVGFEPFKEAIYG